MSNLDIDAGSSRPAIDLAIYHNRRLVGGVEIYMTWLLHNKMPAIVLIPAAARVISHERLTPCVVPLSSAYLWDEHTGEGAHVARSSYDFAAALGLNPYNPVTVLKIAAVIRECLGDLLRMPPMPVAQVSEPVAEMIITDNTTGKILEKEVIDHV